MTIKALVFYALSIGPLNFLLNQHIFSPSWQAALHEFYKPLWWFAMHVPMILQFLVWWVELWSATHWQKSVSRIIPIVWP